MQIRPLHILLFMIGSTATSLAAPSLGDALDFPKVQWVTGGDDIWRPYPGDLEYSHDGEDVAFADVYPFQQAWVETTVPGPGTVEFWWALLSHADQSGFEFSINGVIQSNLVTGTGWQQSQFSFPAGQQTLRWTYRTLDTEDDLGWLDEVVIDLNGPPYVSPSLFKTFDGFPGSNYTLRTDALGSPSLYHQWYRNGTPIPGATHSSLELSDFSESRTGLYTVRVTNSFGSITSAVANITFFPNSIEATEFSWKSFGDGTWFSQTNITHDGVDAAESPAMPPTSALLDSYLETTVTGPGTISFWWRVDAHQEDGGLGLFMDATFLAILFGMPSDWKYESFAVPDGEHVLVWFYENTGNLGFGGTRRGWLDEVKFTPDTTRPKLQITRAASQIVVSWPASYAGYILEATDDPGTSNWSPVTLTGLNTAALDASGPQLFFRLRQP